jgi:hypothetical protein
MGNIGLLETTFIFFLLVLLITTPIFIAWYFIRRARFKEKILLLEKGIDIKDLNLTEKTTIHFPWLRIGIIISGTALGALIVAVVKFDSGVDEAVIVLFTGLSVIAAYFAGKSKDQK